MMSPRLWIETNLGKPTGLNVSFFFKKKCTFIVIVGWPNVDNTNGINEWPFNGVYFTGLVFV